MIRINSIEDLILAIREDQKKQDVRITRFVGVNSVDDWNKLVAHLNQVGDLIRLSSYCSEEDSAPCYDDVLAAARNPSGQYTTVLPISEDIRLLGAGRNYLASLALTEAGGNKRLYVPLFDSSNALHDLETGDARLREHIFCLQGEGSPDYCLQIYASGLRDVDTSLTGYRNYLSLWENGSAVNKVSLSTKFAHTLSLRPAASAVAVYTAYLDVLKERVSDAGLLSSELAPTPEWWAELWARAKNVDSLSDLFVQAFPNCDDARQALHIHWQKSDDFKKWMIWLWCRYSSVGYLQEVLENYTSFSGFTDGVILHIFAATGKAGYSAERRALLRDLGVAEKPARFWEMYGDLRSNQERLLSLTSDSQREKGQIISIYAEEWALGTPDKKMNNLVEQLFPELLHYCLFDAHAEDLTGGISSYFRSYIRSKLVNAVDDDHQQLLAGIEPGDLLSAQARDPLIDSEYNENALLLWVDGLGAEWIGLIHFLLRTKHPAIFGRICLNRCHLPTITEVNKTFLDGRESIKYDALDKLAHDNTNYKYPDSISRQIELVEGILKLAAAELVSHDKVIIVSDHGSSRLAMLEYKSQPAPTGCTPLKWGRCGQTDGAVVCNDPRYIPEGEYLVLRDYGRFTVSGSPAGEVHGGATPEEWLIPTVILSKQPLRPQVELALLSRTYKLRPGSRSVTIEVAATGTPANLKVSTGGQEIEGQRQGSKWLFQVELKPGRSYQLRFTADGVLLLETDVEVTQGISERMDI